MKSSAAPIRVSKRVVWILLAAMLCIGVGAVLWPTTVKKYEIYSQEVLLDYDQAIQSSWVRGASTVTCSSEDEICEYFSMDLPAWVRSAIFSVIPTNEFSCAHKAVTCGSYEFPVPEGSMAAVVFVPKVVQVTGAVVEYDTLSGGEISRTEFVARYPVILGSNSADGFVYLETV